MARTTEALFTQGCAVPWAYIRMMLWRDVFHCDPHGIDPEVVLDTLEVLAAEVMVRKMRR